MGMEADNWAETYEKRRSYNNQVEEAARSRALTWEQAGII